MDKKQRLISIKGMIFLILFVIGLFSISSSVFLYRTFSGQYTFGQGAFVTEIIIYLTVFPYFLVLFFLSLRAHNIVKNANDLDDAKKKYPTVTKEKISNYHKLNIVLLLFAIIFSLMLIVLLFLFARDKMQQLVGDESFLPLFLAFVIPMLASGMITTGVGILIYGISGGARHLQTYSGVNLFDPLQGKLYDLKPPYKIWENRSWGIAYIASAVLLIVISLFIVLY